MGLAEFLILLGVRYGSDETVGWADRVMGFIAAEAREGTLSLIAGTSGGIEPLFALAYRR